jgi:hypothetical protein
VPPKGPQVKYHAPPRRYNSSVSASLLLFFTHPFFLFTLALPFRLCQPLPSLALPSTSAALPFPDSPCSLPIALHIFSFIAIAQLRRSEPTLPS